MLSNNNKKTRKNTDNHNKISATILINSNLMIKIIPKVNIKVVLKSKNNYNST